MTDRSSPDSVAIPGPCVICGGTNYNLSCGGPTICPKCDCGHFDAATVMQQAKVIADLREQLRSAPGQAAPTREDIYACAQTTLIGFRDELTEKQIKFICDQISRKATLDVPQCACGRPLECPECMSLRTESQRVRPYPELVQARDALKEMLSLFDDEGNLACNFSELQQAIWRGEAVLRDTKPDYEIHHDAEPQAASTVAWRWKVSEAQINWCYGEEYPPYTNAVCIEPLYGTQPQAAPPTVYVKTLEDLIQCLIDNDPDELAADGGIRVIDVWRKDAQRALSRPERP
jgi:hypothetical protein